MGKLLNGYILPHPPIIVPTIGKGREKEAIATIEAVKRAAKEIGEDKPSTIILSTPHAPCFKDYVYVSDTHMLSGDFTAFGSPDEALTFQNNRELLSLIIEKAAGTGISAGGLSDEKKKQYGISDRLDHGALVPLYFIAKESNDFRLISISTPFLTLPELYHFGRCIQEAVKASQENVVYVASGDLSHRLTKDAPAGYHPKGEEYDAYLIEKLREGDTQGLLDTEEDFLEKAGECGTRSFVMMLGALHGMETRTDVYSYEGPFGVGYLVAKLNVHGKEDFHQESDYVRLARETLETYIKDQKNLTLPKWVPSAFKTEQAGVFVSLKKDGMLRGCIGTIGPTKPTLAEEIMNNAISSGTQDPRFPTVREEELKDLVYSVDVLGKPEKIDAIEKLDVKRYGVIVTSGGRRGLLLPDLEGVDTPEKQVEIALQKAGIGKSEHYVMERFEVIRYR